MPPNTKRLKTDLDGRPHGQHFNAGLDDYEATLGHEGNLCITSTQRLWRDDFGGSALVAASWGTPTVGSGHTLTVSNSTLVIATGTTPNTETVMTSLTPLS